MTEDVIEADRPHVNVDMMDEMEADAAFARKLHEEFGDKDLEELGKLALGLEDEIKAADQALKDLKKKLERIMRHAIPERLKVIGIDEFGVRLDDGRKFRVTVEIKVLGSLSGAPDVEAAVAYLEEAGMKGTVKSVIEIDYTEDEHAEAEAMLERIKADGRYPHMTRKLSPPTLMAFVRHKLAEDPSFDFAKVGTTAFPQAKFTLRK